MLPAAMSKYPPLHAISTDKLPQLTSDNWIEWSSLLCDVLAPYEGALETLLGVDEPNSPRYSEKQDVELLSLIHRLVSSELQVKSEWPLMNME